LVVSTKLSGVPGQPTSRLSARNVDATQALLSGGAAVAAVAGPAAAAAADFLAFGVLATSTVTGVLTLTEVVDPVGVTAGPEGTTESVEVEVAVPSVTVVPPVGEGVEVVADVEVSEVDGDVRPGVLVPVRPEPDALAGDEAEADEGLLLEGRSRVGAVDTLACLGFDDVPESLAAGDFEAESGEPLSVEADATP
jgi:hypothetical protein